MVPGVLQAEYLLEHAPIILDYSGLVIVNFSTVLYSHNIKSSTDLIFSV